MLPEESYMEVWIHLVVQLQDKKKGAPQYFDESA